MKAMRKTRKLNIYIVIVLIIIVIISAIFLLLKKDNNPVINEEKQASYTIAKGEYTLQSNNNNITITTEDSNKNIYVENYKIKIDFENQDVTNNKYQIEYGTNETLKTDDVTQSNMEIFVDLNEGENNIVVNIKKENQYICKWENTIFYIKPYQKQYLDELEENGYASHFGYPWNPDNRSQVELLKNLGVNCIRDDIRWNLIETKDGKYDYSRYDKWIEEVYKNDIEIIGILGYPDQLIGSDKKFSSQEEVDKFLNFAEDVINRYNGKIMHYEFWNEPNTILLTDEDMKWYSEVVKGLKNIINRINPDIELTIGALRTDGINTDDFNTSDNIINGFYNNDLDAYSDNISLHIYQYKGNNINEYYKTVLKKHNQIFNNLGGFENIFITEQGAATYKDGVDEEEQSNILVTQSIMDDKLGIESEIKYSYRDLQSANSSDEEAIYNFGSVKDDYTPKKSYYAMKNYYENTNGAEYIGTVNLADGLETYVYNKDGKPKLVTWAPNTNVEIEYSNFTAKDMYGEEIENNTGKLNISKSPVYLDNVTTNYYYQAISNTALEKFAEFEEKFADEISKISGFSTKIQEMKQYLTNIQVLQNENEDTARKQMNSLFELGNILIQEYKNGTLNIEKVKLSSMLDMLNGIGDSYEDLVTITATTRNSNLTETNSLIEQTENSINNNSDLNIEYPEKILDFSKELYEKADYINNLEEENDIKTGLIVSKDLHAKYLVEWAQEFSDTYIDEYIENNPITVTYSTTSLTNGDVTVTLNIDKDTKITNNGNSNKYIFHENGDFTFEYERRGKRFTKIVEVNNIDKTAPKITNVVNNEIYITEVAPIIEDENLEHIQLMLNGQVVEGFKSGDTISEQGEYILTAKDKVGNCTEIQFYIILDNYKIVDNRIMNIKQQTSIKQFNITIKIENIDSYEILRNDEVLENDDTICTGDILKTNQGQEYTLIVAGDIDKDGRVSVNDYSMLRLYILRLKDLDDIQMAGADANVDFESINVSDYSRMREIILGLY